MATFEQVASWDAEGLQAQCTALREVLGDGVATPQELADYWPGGAENPEADPLGRWIYCYAQYSRMAGRLDPQKTDADIAKAEADVLAALRHAPVPVELVRTVRGKPVRVEVHPKSFETLLHIEARDRELGRLCEALEGLQGLPAKAQARWGRRLAAEIAYQQQVLCWIVTHPGPGLPFPGGKDAPAVPKRFRDLEAQDCVSILRAHRRVAVVRLGRIADLIGGGKASGKRQSWASLGATAASELGVSSRALLRDWTLESWIAQLSLTADAKAQAVEAAKGKRGAA
ncbi:MAG TPA: hypothetical protein PK308_00110 [Phycisphaerales bacterium]|nr:hypothetical protein [Phycisphaerales bacterium]